MKKTEIIARKAPQVVGPYSQAVKYGKLIFCAGQIGVDPKTNNLAGGIQKQTKQVLNNLTKVLEAAGSSVNQILKTTVFLADMNDFPVMNEIYASYFKKPYPARATVQVAELPKGALIEIECIAYEN